MYNEKKIKKSELLQLILLDNLYAQSGSDRIIFQGGTALRWVYSGMRFKESTSSIIDALKRDLPRFLPQNIIAMYQEANFGDFIAVLREVITILLKQGMTEYFKDYERRKINP